MLPRGEADSIAAHPGVSTKPPFWFPNLQLGLSPGITGGKARNGIHFKYDLFIY
jgi:hypothetical protein